MSETTEARESEAHAPDVEHLSGFDCGRCGHSGMAHYRNPSCRACRCSADPVCWCGLLASKHATPPEVTP